MTTHELAAKLLAGPDLPVQLQVNTNDDGYWGSNVRVEEPTNGTITLFTYQNEADEE